MTTLIKDIAKRAVAGIGTLLPIFCLLLFAGASWAQAAPYFVFGQIMQITEAQAADEEIEDEDLLGAGHPYGLVRVFDADSGAALGQAFANEQGVFTVQYEAPLGSTRNITCRVSVAMTDPVADLELPAAREGINTFSAVGQFFGSSLRVIPPEYLLYRDLTEAGGVGLHAWPGVGIVFTRVGKVEIPFIEQDPADAKAGLADYASDTPDPVTGKTRHEEIYLSGFRDAPFSRGLLIFGDFGEADGLPAECPAPFPGEDVDYYQVSIKELPGAPDSEIVWQQPMTKLRTTVTTAGPISVTSDRPKIGPFTDNSGTIHGLYWVNRNLGEPGFQTIYSFPDQRVNWNTGSWQGAPANGLYEITVKYYDQTGGTLESPQVVEFPSGCFADTPPAGGLGLNKLLLRVDNRDMIFGFNHIWLKHFSTDKYFKPGSLDVDNAVADGALDFNAAGLCEIMELEGQYDVEIDFTAHHPEFMRYYYLTAKPNDGSTVTWVERDYTPPPPLAGSDAVNWSGVADNDVTASKDLFAKCGYIFRLRAGSRLQNGYDYVQRLGEDLSFYVRPLP